MKIIVSAAGFGQRFKEIGITKPKYEIIANNKPLFYWALISLKKFFNNEFIFIFRKEIYDEKFIKKQLIELNINKYNIVLLDEPTEGQASSVMKSNSYFNDDEPFLIWNIDTHINPAALNEEMLVNDGCIITTNASGDRWSFAQLDEDGFVSNVSEKIRISNHASVGLYYFKSWNDFSYVYSNYKKDVISKYGETFVCPFYQYLINQNKKISIFEIPLKDFICLGTPNEISEFDKNWKDKN